jgi:hypothetical protein
MAGKISQRKIADRLGLNVSTVSRVLRGEALVTFKRETVDRVLKAAQRAGYDRCGYVDLEATGGSRRKHPRRKTRVPVSLVIRFMNGSACEKGAGVFKDLSEGGALLGDIRLHSSSVPLRRFTVGFEVTGGELRNLRGEGIPVRISPEDETFALGIRFRELGLPDRERIARLVASA